ncbi:tetraspanin-33-like [Liolophura sinensis]|uniref:tetraspanin-33-like n=1 Tax=Liolophura sinensis TaxID=3198878 RepID=UPI003158F027
MGCLSAGQTYVSPVVKYTLFFYNLLFWLIGLVAVGLGVWAFVEKTKYAEVNINGVADLLFDISIIFIVVGIIIFFLGFCGCIGALRETVILLKIYYIALVVIFLVLVAGSVMAFAFKDQIITALTDELKDTVITKYHDDPELQGIVDWFQEEFQCCGASEAGYKDWNKNMYFNCTSADSTAENGFNSIKCDVPYSCCRNPDSFNIGLPNLLCGADMLQKLISTANKEIYTDGCVDAVIKWAEQNLHIVGIIAVCVAVPQLVGIFLARVLEGQVLDQKAQWEYSRRV